jgi:DNA invertase Pin-like site-specific DNA recombinase
MKGSNVSQRLVGYVRVSRVAGRGDDLVSPQIQRKKISEWAKLHDAQIVRWFDEIDQPGSKLDRPMFQEALSLCENGHANGIVVYRLDRFARSVIHGLECIKRLDEANARFVSVNEGFDAGTDVGRLVITILFAFAELELKKIRQNWSHAVANAIEAGKYIAAKVPVGYVKGDDGRLVVDPATAPYIRQVFLRRAQGLSWRELGEYLAAKGVKTAWGNDYWTSSSLREVVISRAYLGEARSGEIVNLSAHDPIVTEKEWQAAQPDKRTILRKEQSRSSVCVLRGVLVCGGCGHRLLVGSGTNHKGERRPPHYYCRKRHSTGTCPAPAAGIHTVVDGYVEEQLIAAFAHEGPLAEALVRQDRVGDAVAELEDARFALTKYVSNTRLLDTIGLDQFNAGAEAHQRRIDLAEMQLEDAKQQLDSVTSVMSGDLLAAWQGGELTPLERRTIVAKMVDRIILSPSKRPGKRTGADIAERVQIVLRGNELLRRPRSQLARAGTQPPWKPS